MPRWVANLALAMTSLLLCGAALEISLRCFLPQAPLPIAAGELPRVASRPHFQGSIFARNVMAPSAHTVEAWTGATYPISAQGYRGAGFSPHKGAGITRILVYGGSAAFDVGRSGEDDWPSHAGRLLRARGYDAEVINAATPGHASFDSLGRFLAEGHRFGADVVLIYHTWNDLKYFGDARPLLWIYEPYRPERDPLARARGRLDAQLADLSHLYRLLRLRFLVWSYRDQAEGAPPSAELRDTFEPEQVAQFELVVATFVDLVRNAGGRPVLMLQARLPTEESPEEQRKRVRNDFVGLTHEALVRAYAAADAAILRVARAKDVPVIDAHTPLSGRDENFLDGVHLTATGSDALAVLVADHLAEILDGGGEARDGWAPGGRTQPAGIRAAPPSVRTGTR